MTHPVGTKSMQLFSPAKGAVSLRGDNTVWLDQGGISVQMQPVPRPDDERILWGVVANAGRLSGERKVRWGHVVDATGQGSTRSAELCRRFGFDPDEVVGGVEPEDQDEPA